MSTEYSLATMFHWLVCITSFIQCHVTMFTAACTDWYAVRYLYNVM